MTRKKYEAQIDHAGTVYKCKSVSVWRRGDVSWPPTSDLADVFTTGPAPRAPARLYATVQRRTAVCDGVITDLPLSMSTAPFY
ncbi:hypothetical protein KGM_202944 [Danaus plexippus plexippus]|uniref:Uncharacterized protein n=1 Tax=Danaus plexippus plexippus TaxID=278856 RepID=A0A212F7P5_DANPL|nr:hypothetical protein KGM_202944 [Danaus plexippus plexippus]